jgi:hypothetical protein
LGIGAPTFTQTYHWYHVLAKVDMANDKWYAWVDGQKIVDGTSPGNQQAHDSFTHYFVGIGNFSSGATGVVYYDNVWLYWK